MKRSGLVLQELEDTFRTIQAHNPDVPDTFITFVKTNKNQAAEHKGDQIKFSAFMLDHTGEKLVGILLHEAAHALAGYLNLEDTKGLYHLDGFRYIAEQLGLKSYWYPDKVNGWSTDILTEAARSLYGFHIAAINEGLKLL